MADAYVGEIRWLVCLNGQPPAGWLKCDGSAVSINQYQILYSLIANTYGGSGPSTFLLPDLCGRVALHMGQGSGLTNRPLASNGGSDGIVLTVAQMAGHTHTLQASSNAATTVSPAANEYLGTVASDDTLYTSGFDVQNPSAQLSAQAIQTVGGGGSHENRAPTLPIDACICFDGIYPPHP